MPPQEAPSTPLAEPHMPMRDHAKVSLRSLILLVAALVALLLIASVVYVVRGSSSEQNNEPKKIGILSMRQFNDVVSGFKAEMARLGYEDAEYLEIATNPGPTLMQDIDAAVRVMVDADVDVIWTSLEQQAKGAVDVTRELGRTDIPIVFMTRFHDPVDYGIIASFRSSGNNATGVATDLREIIQRTLQFYKEIDPAFKKLGVFSDGYMVPGVGEEYLAKLKEEAPRFGIEIVEYKTTVPPPQVEAEFYRVSDTIERGDIDGIFHIPGHFYNIQEAGEGKLAERLGIPMAAPFEDLPNGGTFSYSDDFGGSGRASAVLLDKIFKGADPSDIPVEYGGNNILTLMLGRAREAGIVFPESMIFIAKNAFEDNSAFETESLNH